MNKFLKFLFLGQSINLLADHLLIPIFALFVLSVGGSAQLAGILWGIQFAISAVIGFFVLKLRDRRNLDYTLLKANYLIKAIAWILLVFNQSIPTMIIAQVLIGFAAAIGGPSFNAVTAEHLDRNQHIKDWGSLQLISNSVIAIASVISGIIMVNYGFVIIFMLMSLLEFISLIIILSQKPPIKENY